MNGAAVELVLKSGTNQFHGSAYGYVQDYRFDANSYQHGYEGLPTSPYSFSQFGGNVGGPILRNKLFFFGDYLGSRWHEGGLSTASVIPDAMRNGDFSVLLTASNPIQLYDPQNNFAPYANNKGVPDHQSSRQIPFCQSKSLSGLRRRQSCDPQQAANASPRAMESRTTTTRLLMPATRATTRAT